ncbi:hypothetical protein [Pararhodobacter marinus]|uniref:hypothetical protein n=1 Tax=Pararhodobacter marinus TaxID=2184063 RepID=UPI00351862D3
MEVDLLILSFLGHFSWEVLQAPLFSSLNNTPHFAGILMCLQATFGDLGIALVSYWGSVAVAGGREWARDPTGRAVAVFLAFGLAATIVLEFVNTEILNRWSYADQMPRLPILGTGLSPLLQWVIVPALVVWYLARLAPVSRGG